MAEFTYKHFEWWICLFIAICFIAAITVLGDDVLHDKPDTESTSSYSASFGPGAR